MLNKVMEEHFPNCIPYNTNPENCFEKKKKGKLKQSLWVQQDWEVLLHTVSFRKFTMHLNIAP